MGPKRRDQYLTASWLTSMPALMQEVLDVPQREREADVKHHREADDLGRVLK
jgi:hypothetical protein